jgi:hypothetical protein
MWISQPKKECQRVNLCADKYSDETNCNAADGCTWDGLNGCGSETDPNAAAQCSHDNEIECNAVGADKCSWFDGEEESCMDYKPCAFWTTDECEGKDQSKEECYWDQFQGCQPASTSTVTETSTTSTTETTTSTFHCTPTKVGEIRVQCGAEEQCIREDWLCDGGKPDCDNGHDEVNCETTKAPTELLSVLLSCKNDEQMCDSNDECYKKTYACNGETDCKDKSDEKGCATEPSTVTTKTKTTAMAGQTDAPVLVTEYVQAATLFFPSMFNQASFSTDAATLGALSDEDIVLSAQFMDLKIPVGFEAAQVRTLVQAENAKRMEAVAAAASAPLYLTLHSLCDPREDKCDPALDLQCDPAIYACRYLSDDAAFVDTDGIKVPLSVVVGIGALVVLMLIVGVVLKCKSRPPDTNVGNGDEYINPAFHQGNTSPAYETSPGHDDAAYDFVTGALTMVQGNSGDPDHVALANATYAAGVGTEESCAAVAGSTDDGRLSFANATYTGLDGDCGVEASSGYGSGAGDAEASYADLSEC